MKASVFVRDFILRNFPSCTKIMLISFDGEREDIK